jgi:aminopeptidase N
VAVGGTVSEEQLQLLLGICRDPASGEPLGRAYPAYRSVDERIRVRVQALGRGLSRDDRTAAVTRIEAEEHGRSRRRAVAGYDFTFSAPKSVSALWAVADADTQSVIVAEHHAAVADVIALMERDVAATRTGFNAVDGAVAQSQHQARPDQDAALSYEIVPAQNS